MNDSITLTGLRVRGFHGVLPEERRDGQDFVVDVVLSLDVAAAAATDDLALTADYGALSERLAAVVEGDAVDLLETLASRLADACLVPPVRAVEVTVHKPSAPIARVFTDVSVTVRRTA